MGLGHDMGLTWSYGYRGDPVLQLVTLYILGLTGIVSKIYARSSENLRERVLDLLIAGESITVWERLNGQKSINFKTLSFFVIKVALNKCLQWLRRKLNSIS